MSRHRTTQWYGVFVPGNGLPKAIEPNVGRALEHADAIGGYVLERDVTLVFGEWRPLVPDTLPFDDEQARPVLEPPSDGGAA